MSGILQTLIASIGGAINDIYFNLVTLLLPGNGTNGAQNNTFLDSSTNNFTITRNGNTTQGTFSPFSQTGWSGNFNTSTTYLTVTDTANLRFGSSNFTIEAWVYRAASGAIQTIASKGASTPTGWVFQISAADKLVFTDTSTSITGATTLNANTWYYVAVVRAGTGTNQTTLYVNAASDATGTSSTNFNQTNNMLIGADRSTANFANGYISNLRLSNTNRTISSTPTSALTADANTIFLALNSNWFQYTDSTAAYTAMAVTGTPSVQAFSPFAPTDEYSAATVGGSGYFDGSDWLTVGAASDWTFMHNGSDWTCEFWVNYTGTAAYTIASTTAFSAQIGFTIAINSTYGSGLVNGAQLYTVRGDGVSEAIFNSTALLVPGQWNYVAITFTSSTKTCAFTINGASAGSTANTGFSYSSSNPTNTLAIGRFQGTSPGNYLVGYLGSLRISTNIRTGLTTVPTSPYTSDANTKLLTNYTNAGITDATAKNDLETVGNAQISTTQSKFGGSSMSFDGTGDYLLVPHTVDQMLGTGAFTIEMWIYRNASGTYGLVGKGTGTTGWLVSLNSSNQVVFTYGSSTITSTGTISATTWTYIAVVREGTGTNQTKIYISGSNDGTGTVSTDFNQTNAMYVGADRTGGSNYNGYIDDLRITKGFARTIATPSLAFALQ